jgi:hypothetical protein
MGQRKTITTQDDLKKQYLGWRRDVGYDAKNNVVKGQLDQIWDDKMKEDSNKIWDPKHPDIQSLRATGKLGSAYGNKNQNAPLVNAGQKSSPFITHVQDKVQAQTPAMVQVKKPDGSIVKVPKGEWESQKEAAIRSGWSE